MKKGDVVDLIRYHCKNDNDSFVDKSFKLAKEFENDGDITIAQIIQGILQTSDSLNPQSNSFYDDVFIRKITSKMINKIYLPDSLKSDLDGIINAIKMKKQISKFLFYGMPGTGKTESAKYVANATDRILYSINFSNLIDCRLGETLKNIERLFVNINHSYNLDKSIFFFDEIDVLALDRINSNDVREMGRATSLFLKCLDSLDENAIIIGTTNLYNNLDCALKRRFDYVVNFNRYGKNDLKEIGLLLVKEYLQRSLKKEEEIILGKLFKNIPSDKSPSELRNTIKIAIAFDFGKTEYEYIRNIILKLFGHDKIDDFRFLKALDLTTREMESITGVSRSSISRRIKD